MTLLALAHQYGADKKVKVAKYETPSSSELRSRDDLYYVLCNGKYLLYYVDPAGKYRQESGPTQPVKTKTTGLDYSDKARDFSTSGAAPHLVSHFCCPSSQADLLSDDTRNWLPPTTIPTKSIQAANQDSAVNKALTPTLLRGCAARRYATVHALLVFD